MRGQIFKYWDRVRSGFWLLPTVMAGVAVALAFVSVAISEPVTEWFTLNFGWTFTGGAEGASAVLGIIAGSMITIAGVVFSMTLVALSLASSQLGPRLLRSFMRDSATQVVLGTFIATFLYCLLVLRTIRRAEEVAFVPHLSVTLGVLLAVASVGVLIYFIHHVSVSIQANEIAARIGRELIEGIDRLFPEHVGRGAPRIPTEPPEAGFLEAFDQEARPVGADGDGYLQFIDGEALVALATEEDLVVRLERRPGNYVVARLPAGAGLARKPSDRPAGGAGAFPLRPGPPADCQPGHRVRGEPTGGDRGAGPLPRAERPVHGDHVCGPPGLRVVSFGDTGHAVALSP